MDILIFFSETMCYQFKNKFKKMNLTKKKIPKEWVIYSNKISVLFSYLTLFFSNSILTVTKKPLSIHLQDLRNQFQTNSIYTSLSPFLVIYPSHVYFLSFPVKLSFFWCNATNLSMVPSLFFCFSTLTVIFINGPIII